MCYKNAIHLHIIKIGYIFVYNTNYSNYYNLWLKYNLLTQILFSLTWYLNNLRIIAQFKFTIM